MAMSGHLLKWMQEHTNAMSPDSRIAENLILDLIEWVERREHTVEETRQAWRTSCPRLPVWEDATDRGFLETARVNGRPVVRASLAGLAFLKEQRPAIYQDLGQRHDPP
jgi:hypothetical protein